MAACAPNVRRRRGWHEAELRLVLLVSGNGGPPHRRSHDDPSARSNLGDETRVWTGEFHLDQKQPKDDLSSRAFCSRNELQEINAQVRFRNATAAFALEQQIGWAIEKWQHAPSLSASLAGLAGFDHATPSPAGLMKAGISASFEGAVVHSSECRGHTQHAEPLLDVMPTHQQRHQLDRKAELMRGARAERPEQPRAEQHWHDQPGDQVAHAL